MNSSRAALLSISAAALVSGCSLFSQTPSAASVARVHRVVPTGTLMDAAESDLVGIGFQCSQRRGDCTDEQGRDRSASSYVRCTERPGSFSFACQNRDEVILVPSGNVVGEVHVLRGPDCAYLTGSQTPTDRDTTDRANR